jgi:hypothetical protein
MTVSEYVAWIDSSPLSMAIKSAVWVVPTVQSVHILSVCIVFSASVILCLRACNVTGCDWSLQQWGQRLYPPLWWALLLLLLSGLLLIIGEPGRELFNIAFQLKMLGVLVAAGMTPLLARHFAGGLHGAAATAGLKMLTIMHILLWLGIIFAGRWIAYI